MCWDSVKNELVKCAVNHKAHTARTGTSAGTVVLVRKPVVVKNDMTRVPEMRGYKNNFYLNGRFVTEDALAKTFN